MTSRVRKDAVVSATMSYNMRVLLDTLADARAMSRSEYVRYLVLQDAQDTTPRIVAAAVDESATAKQGRPKLQDTLKDSFLIDEAKARYGAMVRDFQELLGDDLAVGHYFVNVGGEPCIVWNESAYNYDDFRALSKEDRIDIIEAKRQERQDIALAERAGF